MAERLKHKILEQEKMVDIICGPDAYKDLPQLLASTFSSGHAAGRLWRCLECCDAIQFLLSCISNHFINVFPCL